MQESKLTKRNLEMKKEKKIPFKNKFAKGTVWEANQDFDIEVTRMIKSFRDKKKSNTLWRSNRLYISCKERYYYRT